MFQYTISKLPNDRFLFWWQQDFYVLTSHSEGSSQVAMLDTCHSRRSWHCIQQVALPSAPAKRAEGCERELGPSENHSIHAVFVQRATLRSTMLQEFL
jgi:hypothetical protein